MAERFLSRFCLKVNRHRPALLDNRIERALGVISRATSGEAAEFSRRTHWIEPALDSLMQEEAEYLYEEAISYGLILESARGEWTWRHEFVRGRLRGC